MISMVRSRQMTPLLSTTSVSNVNRWLLVRENRAAAPPINCSPNQPVAKVLLRASCFSTKSQPSHDEGSWAPSFDRASIRGPHGIYADEYARSLREPEKFWMEAADQLEWFTKPTIALEQDSNNPYMYRWFPNGILNTCYNCLDVHCNNGRGDQVAMYYDSAMTGVKQQFT